MSMKKLLLTLSFPVLLFTFTVHAQDTARAMRDTTHVEATTHVQGNWDLTRCVEYALANNISVKQADVQARIAKLTLNQSKLAQIPTLTVGSSAGINSGR